MAGTDNDTALADEWRWEEKWGRDCVRELTVLVTVPVNPVCIDFGLFFAQGLFVKGDLLSDSVGSQNCYCAAVVERIQNTVTWVKVPLM